MTTRAVIESKANAVKKYLQILERYKKISLKEIEKDVDLKGAAERYLYLAVQAAIDLADALISFKDLRKPETLSDNFEILRAEKIISDDLADRLTKMVGFRNILAHDYGKVDYAVVGDILRFGLKDLEKFLAAVAKSVR